LVGYSRIRWAPRAEGRGLAREAPFNAIRWQTDLGSFRRIVFGVAFGGSSLSTTPTRPGPHFGLEVDNKEVARSALVAADVAPLDGPFLDFRDLWGNRIALYFLAEARICLGQFDEAVAALKKRLERSRNSETSYALLASCYSHLGKIAESRAAWAELMRLVPDFSIERRRRVLPFRNPDSFERRIEGMRKAGLPVYHGRHREQGEAVQFPGVPESPRRRAPRDDAARLGG
jgi:tetratricopeptide (TPR) repeat protein